MTQNHRNPPGFNAEIFRQALEDDAETSPTPAEPEADRSVAVAPAGVSAEISTVSENRNKSPEKQAMADTHADQAAETGSDRFSWLAMIIIGLSIIAFSVSNWMTNNRVEALTGKVAALEARLDQVPLSDVNVDSDSDSTAAWLQDVAEEINSGDEKSVSKDTVPVELPPNKEDSDPKVVADVPEKPEPFVSQLNADTAVHSAVVATEQKSVRRSLPLAASGEILKLSGSVQKYVLAPVGNGREAPDTNSRVVVRLKKGTTVKAMLRQGEWYQIQLGDGTNAWSHQSIFGPPPLSLPADKGSGSKAEKQGEAHASGQNSETLAVTGLMAAEKNLKPEALAKVADRPEPIEPGLNTPEAQLVKPDPSPVIDPKGNEKGRAD